jgi:hypothetical protein
MKTNNIYYSYIARTSNNEYIIDIFDEEIYNYFLFIDNNVFYNHIAKIAWNSKKRSIHNKLNCFRK